MKEKPLPSSMHERVFLNLREEVFSRLIERDEDKYKWFLKGIDYFRKFAQNKNQGNLLEASYVLFRYIDDVVDGDLPLPEHVKSKEDYVLEKITKLNVKEVESPYDQIDDLMNYCLSLADKLNINIKEETNDILNSMLFDAKRYGRNEIFTEKELKEHFFQLDIRGTIVGALKLFHEDHSKYTSLTDLGTAVRIYYNLRDLSDDFKKGFINISSEDIEAYGIDYMHLNDLSKKPILRWRQDQAAKGFELLKRHDHNQEVEKFSMVARTVFWLMYESPAKKYFHETLKNN